jgi:prepilin-type N-terminal cleavage/methylation domain-containing protein
MRMRTSFDSGGAPRGFSLLELVLAMGVLGILMAGIFAVAKSTTEMSGELTSQQERTMMKQNLIEFLRRSFRSLPGGAELRLENRQSGGVYIPSLTVVNGGICFSPGAAMPPDIGLELTAEERPGGYLRLLLRTLDEKQTISLRSGQQVRTNNNNPTLPLADGVSQFEWRFYDPYSDRWETVWRDARRPLMAELNLQLDDGQPLRAVFWIPPVARGMGLGAFPGGGMPVDPNDPNAPPIGPGVTPLNPLEQ